MSEHLGQEREILPELQGLHERVVATGMFDTLPAKTYYGEGEKVVYRYNGDIYYIADTGEETVRIWYQTDVKSADETVPRNDVRGIAPYARLLFEIGDPLSEVEIDDYGKSKLRIHVLPLEGPPPPFPGDIK